MKKKIFERVCDWSVYVSPFLLYIITQIYKQKNFDSNIYMLLCVSVALLSVAALIISIVFEVRNMKEMKITNKRKILLLTTFTMGIVLYFILRLVDR